MSHHARCRLVAVCLCVCVCMCVMDVQRADPERLENKRTRGQIVSNSGMQRFKTKCMRGSDRFDIFPERFENRCTRGRIVSDSATNHSKHSANWVRSSRMLLRTIRTQLQAVVGSFRLGRLENSAHDGQNISNFAPNDSKQSAHGGYLVSILARTTRNKNAHRVNSFPI